MLGVAECEFLFGGCSGADALATDVILRVSCASFLGLWRAGKALVVRLPQLPFE
jgi:hypothetical protein